VSNVKPDGPYVYQPFGMKEREHWNARRIYAVGGMDRLATLTGLTEGEAYSVVDALRGLTRLARVEAENKRLREALTWIAAQSCRRDAPCFELNACITERCETCYARAALKEGS